jgi:hypothetical protein
MKPTEFYAILERDLSVQNPTSPEKLLLLAEYEEALDWVRRAVRPGGCIAIGEPFLHEGLTEEERRELEEREGISQNLPGLVASLEARGLSLTGMIAATTDDWDRYESAHWRAARAWGEEHPEHPERAWLLARVSEGRERYLRLERRALGWAIFVARLPGLLPSP